MKLAIMQPYFLPYIGYFQLMKAVDKFVVYDDVAFINKGWINRNHFLVGGQSYLFTVPLNNASQNRLILDVTVSAEEAWKKKLLKTIAQSYVKAPFYPTVFPLVEKLINFESRSVSDLAVNALVEIKNYLGLATEIVPSSMVYNNQILKAQDRILDICRQENAETYINPSGGRELYDRDQFSKEGIRLFFIQSKPVTYPQFKNAFVPWLSILDVLMFNDKIQVLELLDNYELT